MSNYKALSHTIVIDKKNRLIGYDESLKLIGTGRSAFVFKIKSTQKVIKIFFPNYTHLAKEEAAIYEKLQGVAFYPSTYDSGCNYIVMDYIEGHTLFECITRGVVITCAHIKKIDEALLLASDRGLNPSDIHLRNIIITSSGEIKIIDVARFRQTKDCMQWNNLKKSYRQLYQHRYFPKKISAHLLNVVAFLYKNGLLPSYRR